MRYAFYMYDEYLKQKLVGKLPIEYKEKEYTIETLGKDIESIAICQHIANDFNTRIVNHLPDKRLLLNFIHCFVYQITSQTYKSKYTLFAVENYIDGKYEKYNNNAGWVADSFSETSLVAHAFSHFSWQITKGYLMIVDLQGVSGILTDPQIHCLNKKKFGKGNLGYYGMMKFFLTHCCNEYCELLELVHPRKKKKIDSSFDFFVEKYKAPRNDDETYVLCDLCRKPFLAASQLQFEKKTACQEIYCEPCDKERQETMLQEYCIDCGKSFYSSEYWFKMKRTDFPVRCSRCRLENRNRLRKENEKKII